MADSGHQPSPAEAAWKAHYKRIYPEGVFTPAYMADGDRTAFISAKMAVASLSALRKAARAVLNESAEGGRHHPEQEWPAAYRALAALL